MKELEALFEKHGIPKKDYTPEATETEPTKTAKAEDTSLGNQSTDWMKLVELGIKVIGMFTNKSA